MLPFYAKPTKQLKFVLRHFEFPKNTQVKFMLNENILENTSELYK